MSATISVCRTFPAVTSAAFERACWRAPVYIHALCLSFRAERVAWPSYLPVVFRSSVFVEVHASVVVGSGPCCCPCTAFAVIPAEISLSVEFSVFIVFLFVLYACYSSGPAV